MSSQIPHKQESRKNAEVAGKKAKAAHNEKHAEKPAQEMQCNDGMCTLSWKPQRSEAA